MTGAAGGAVSIDGQIFAPEEARVSIFDYGFLYGDGVFETMRTYGRRPFRLGAHLSRLADAVRTTGIAGVPSSDVLAGWVEETLARCDSAEAYCRITVTRGRGGPRFDPSSCRKATVVIAALPLTPIPEERYDRGLRCVLLWARAPEDRPPVSVKSTSYQRSVLGRGEVQSRDADEGFFLDGAGGVTEGTTSNVFAWTGSVLVTPPTTHCLPGITRAEVLDIARERGLEVHERVLTVDDLRSAHEVFVTSSLFETMPVARIEDFDVGGGSRRVTHELRVAYHRRANLTRGT